MDKKEHPKDIFKYCYKIRHLCYHDGFHFSSITSRQCLEDTYEVLLLNAGLLKVTKYKLILWLMRLNR